MTEFNRGALTTRVNPATRRSPVRVGWTRSLCQDSQSQTTTHHLLRSALPMSSAALTRVARASFFSAPSARLRPVRALQAQPFRPAAVAGFSSASRRLSDDHHEESFEEFTARYDRPVPALNGALVAISAQTASIRRSHAEEPNPAPEKCVLM